jgi:hypothetical protein
MARRSVDVLAAAPVKARKPASGESLNVSVRPIDNGYILCRSHCKPNGEYVSTETYSRDRPMIDVGGTKAAPTSSLRDAVKSLGGRGTP